MELVRLTSGFDTTADCILFEGNCLELLSQVQGIRDGYRATRIMKVAPRRY